MGLFENFGRYPTLFVLSQRVIHYYFDTADQSISIPPRLESTTRTACNFVHCFINPCVFSLFSSLALSVIEINFLLTGNIIIIVHGAMLNCRTADAIYVPNRELDVS